ncbi:hypothetical protein AchV4_0065 [Achromobacter phage vB_AchrS_AchV4]|uniref:Uncharacterized protein n=1 Tax=Achromobacter phage vB_AchrS_AchV4 TaxID=2796514 RepID=A0A7T3PGZ6_9CAUD|nr:hypothetical protein JT316_gp65 [Achromobacter phage vB_AchrS_AchV4]QPZ53315.1 hypothetical protein AchV4_0065 [Achromobacter phage vB_AchrS_AchV4]
MGGKIPHDYRIEVWNEREQVEDTLAECSNYFVAEAAFEEACKQRPGKEVTLRQGARVLASSKR